MRATAPTRNTRPTKTFDRACRVWRETANVIRSDIRAAGKRGSLRQVADYCTGKRGKETPSQLAALAVELRDAGVPLALAQVRLAALGVEIAGVIYSDDGKIAA